MLDFLIDLFAPGLRAQYTRDEYVKWLLEQKAKEEEAKKKTPSQ